MSKFSRMDYVSTASVLATLPTSKIKVQAVDGFIQLYKADNPNFDEIRFVDACHAE